jgi:hypothetical protein
MVFSNSRIGVVALTAIALLAAGWFSHSALAGDFQAVDLPDGRRLVLLRHLDEAYPVYAKTLKAELDLALEQKKKVFDATAGGKYEQGARQLYQDLDAVNADVRTTVVAAYSGFALTLSAAANASQVADAIKKWDDVLQLIIKESARIRGINQQLAAANTATSGAGWDKLTDLGGDARRGAEELKALVEANAPGTSR